ncbi:hypothetical protein WJX81_007903 [Elliptochloris bilobata]|uniref:SUMO-activating enzyme subunit n=1 Tax=Elliptochloris bilobata TaxID=381761 RepID=A0AAW1S8T1_9CHLO
MAWPAAASSAELRDKIKTSKVLCVGAGGIGCELLKTLVLTGFEDIELIDMDTIETSNLNRQFLFRRKHVGQSKAKVAAEAVQRFRPNARILAHQGNVKDAAFGLDFFRRFKIVLNGLDNVEARRHVNRLCLAARVPLIESGTTGYLGQVTVHLRMRGAAGQVTAATECYECKPAPMVKSFPVCTIRNTPDKPIHCIVWAKDLLFARLFGRLEGATDLDEGAEGAAGAAQGDAALGSSGREADGAPGPSGEESPAAEDLSEFLAAEGENPSGYAARIFRRVFCADIESVLKMDKLWKNRKPPMPLRLGELLPEAGSAASGRASGGGADGGGEASACEALGMTDAHRLWSVEDNAQVFLESVRLFMSQRRAEVGAAVFDKDDALAVEFVAAASNLRSAAYGIPMQTLFAAKGMAGNIIHAIATTNAIVGGLIVVEALKILAGQPDKCKVTYVLEHQSSKRLLATMPPDGPSRGCAVCGTAQLRLAINTRTATLSHLVSQVLKKRLAMNEPTIMACGFMYEEGEGLQDDEVAANAALLPRVLADLPGGGLGHGVLAVVRDQSQDVTLQLLIEHQEEWDEEMQPDGFTVDGAAPAPAAAANGDAAAGPSGADAAEEDDDDDLVVVVEPHAADAKRKRAATDEAGVEAEEGREAARRRRGPADAGTGDAILLD